MKETVGSAVGSRASFHGWLITGVWVVTFIAIRFLLDREWAFSSNVRLAMALVPILPTALFLWHFVTVQRGMDELHRKVQLEALVIAYPLAILLLVTLGFLQLAIDLPAEDWSYRHVWYFLPCFYFLGLAIAWRRYR